MSTLLYLDDLNLGARTFFAAGLPFNECSVTGLPLTPNSIKIIGRFQILKTIKHPNICRYIDIFRRKGERLIVVAEFYSMNLGDPCKRSLYQESQNCFTLALHLLSALEHLHEKNIIHRNLSPQCILFTKEGNVKLSNYGLYHMSINGTSVIFPIGVPRYMSPEVLVSGREAPSHFTSSKADIWSLGMILLELALGIQIFESISLKEVFLKIIDFLYYEDGKAVVESIAKEYNVENILQEMDCKLRLLLEQMLHPNPKQRPKANVLLEEDVLFYKILNERPEPNELSVNFLSKTLNSSLIPNIIKDTLSASSYSHRSLNEIYYLWQIASGEIETDMQKRGLISYNPPLCMLQSIIRNEGVEYPNKRDRTWFYHDVEIPLNFNQLKQRVEHMSPYWYIPSANNESGGNNNVAYHNNDLPLVILETDVEHQFQRFIIFEKLLRGYPYTKKQISLQARIDIPPLYRSHIWAALLKIAGNLEEVYNSIDKVTPNTTDRQIEVDIPRCHQYDELLSSPIGHAKFKRILKAWISSHPQFVYWQGLDSLCAPFIRLNFTNEALAFGCLSAFITKYLTHFFQKDNTAVIQEYLAVFSHLLAYHDVELYNHLSNIGFQPELYAIPWFLTMYTHVFPLPKIYHLWDTLLLGDSSIPLFIGIAILKQLRNDLLSFSFNDCILMFSDMPDISIDKCVEDAVQLFTSTLPSASFRKSSINKVSKKTSFFKLETETVANMMVMDIPLEVLKQDTSPQISPQDALELLKSDYKVTPQNKILVIDCRSHHKYLKGTLPRAINMPYEHTFTSEGTLNTGPEASCLISHKGHMVLVFGSNKNADSSKFASKLVELGYSKVCMLHGGIESFQHSSIIIFPPL